MRTLMSVFLLIVAFVCGGCASIVSGTNQTLSVTTHQKGDLVSDAKCRMVNNKGEWYVTTPGSVTVHRSFGDMSVKCEKEQLEPGIATVKSSTKGMAFGNIIFGGIIGAGVDMTSGAAYDYPGLIKVEMGTTQFLRRSKESADESEEYDPADEGQTTDEAEQDAEESPPD